MENLSFEAATNEYYRAASALEMNAPEPDAERSERISEGWLFRDTEGEPTAIVRDDGAVWGLRGSVTPPKAAGSSFGPLSAKPDIAASVIEVLVTDDGYYIDFRDALLDELDNLDRCLMIANHLEAVSKACAQHARALDEAAKREAYARHSRDMLESAKQTNPMFDDDIPF
jgi:hypothetical protein